MVLDPSTICYIVWKRQASLFLIGSSCKSIFICFQHLQKVITRGWQDTEKLNVRGEMRASCVLLKSRRKKRKLLWFLHGVGEPKRAVTHLWEFCSDHASARQSEPKLFVFCWVLQGWKKRLQKWDSSVALLVVHLQHTRSSKLVVSSAMHLCSLVQH